MRSSMFRSSRTLFFRQSYALKRVTASGAIVFGRMQQAVAGVVVHREHVGSAACHTFDSRLRERLIFVRRNEDRVYGIPIDRVEQGLSIDPQLARLARLIVQRDERRDIKAGEPFDVLVQAACVTSCSDDHHSGAR